VRAREHARREELRALRHRGFGGRATFLEVSLSVEKGLSAARRARLFFLFIMNYCTVLYWKTHKVCVF
jgi:hypothetical protein